LTYNPRLAKVKVDPHAKNQGQRSNGSNRSVPTANGHTHKDIISPATRSINIQWQYISYILCKYYENRSRNPRDYEGNKCTYLDEMAKMHISPNISPTTGPIFTNVSELVDVCMWIIKLI